MIGERVMWEWSRLESERGKGWGEGGSSTLQIGPSSSLILAFGQVLYLARNILNLLPSPPGVTPSC